MVDPFPLYLPPEARRLFQTESLLRRFAQAAHWDKDSELLELHGSLGGLALTKALGCRLTVVEPDAKVAESLKERAKVAGILDKVTFLDQGLAGLEVDEGAFDGVFSLGKVVGPLAALAGELRRFIAPRGRLGLTWVVKVGRTPPKEPLDYWAARLGQPLLMPREALIAVETKGYEPEMIETVSDGELDDYYKELEALLARGTHDGAGVKALREEMAVHRAQSSHSGVALAVVIARRKEPGEKPPPSRDAG